VLAAVSLAAAGPALAEGTTVSATAVASAAVPIAT
jgi:hypothetical protein